MFKRKRKSSEYDDDFLPPLDMGYGEEPPNDSVKKRKRGCVSALVAVSLMVVCDYIAYRAIQNSSGARPTLAADDGQPVPVEEGLVFADYAVNGQQIGVYDLDGKVIEPSDSPPLYVPVSPAENPLAGLDSIAYPEGAFYDADSGQLVVFGPPAEGPSTLRDDFFAALRAVYGGSDPGASIDPSVSQTVQDVRYIGQTENTHLGWVMFEADRRMKTLSMGQDNITGASVTSSVPGFANKFDLEIELGSQNQDEVRRRFWFKVPIAEIEQTPDGQGMLITALSLSVDTEYLDANWQTSTSQPPNPAGRAFAAHLTDHYDEYADEFPVFDELKVAARWTVLAHWLQKADLPLQPELWLNDSPPPYSDAPLTTPAITATRQNQQGNIIQTLTLWGGVDLAVEPVVKPASAATLGLMEDLANRFKLWTGFAKVEPAGEGFTFSPFTASQIRRDAVSALELPLPGAPSLLRNPDGWTLQVPHLTREGSDQNAIYFFKDPAESQPIALTYQGRDPETNADVFADKERGLRLDIYADGYQLLFGRFQGEQFSYRENDWMFFDLQGNILNDAKTGKEYVYSDGLLTNTRHGGNDLEISWNQQGKIRRLNSADGENNFIYEDGRLTAIRGVDNQPIRALTYEDGRLVGETGVNGGAEETIRYDAEGRVLFSVVDDNPILYDWRNDGTLTQVSGRALLPWRHAKSSELEDLKREHSKVVEKEPPRNRV